MGIAFAAKITLQNNISPADRKQFVGSRAGGAGEMICVVFGMTFVPGETTFRNRTIMSDVAEIGSYDGQTIFGEGEIVPGATKIISDAGEIISDAGEIISDAAEIISRTSR